MNRNPEADEVSFEDLEAAADYLDDLVTNNLPHNRAKKIAEELGVTLTPRQLDSILAFYACSGASLESCVKAGTGYGKQN